MEKNNNYLIYALKHRYVHADSPKKLGGYRIRGWVDDVYRDVITGRIEIKVGKNKYIFEMPDKILGIDGDVLFVYGEEIRDDDESLMQEFRDVSGRGGGFDRAMKNLEHGSILLIHFEIAHERERPKIRGKLGRPKKRGVKKGSTRRNKMLKRKAVPGSKEAAKKLSSGKKRNSKNSSSNRTKRKMCVRKRRRER